MGNSIGIVFTTLYLNWYPGKLRDIADIDKVRGDLALESLRIALDKNYQAVVVDAQSSLEFIAALRAFNNIHLHVEKGIKRSPAKRKGFEIASKLEGVKVIVSTEPEKTSFLTDGVEASVEPILKGKADIVIPKRNQQLMEETYPDFQIESESDINILYNEYLRVHGLMPTNAEDIDMVFGPRVFRSDLKTVRLFMHVYDFPIGRQYDLEQLSNAMYFPVVLALKENVSILNVEVPFKYPALQKENEVVGKKIGFLAKRRYQRISLLIELMHFVQYFRLEQ